jgi:hypothetical protein
MLLPMFPSDSAQPKGTRSRPTRFLNHIGERPLPHPPCRPTTADDPHQDDQDAGADEGDDDAAPERIRPPAENAHQHADIRTTEVYFIRKEEDAEVAARKIQIRVTGRKEE